MNSLSGPAIQACAYNYQCTKNCQNVNFFIKNNYASDHTKNYSTVVLGDFNLPPLSQLTPHFEQLITEPTYDQGSVIDHLYTNFELKEHFTHSVIFSDHDAISFTIEQ